MVGYKVERELGIELFVRKYERLDLVLAGMKQVLATIKKGRVGIFVVTEEVHIIREYQTRRRIPVRGLMQVALPEVRNLLYIRLRARALGISGTDTMRIVRGDWDLGAIPDDCSEFHSVFLLPSRIQ